MKKLIRNQQGVSLVEVMVAAGISSVIALATMKINENAQQGMRNVATKAAVTNYLNYRMGNLLEDNAVCMAAFDVNGDNNPGDTVNVTVGNNVNLDGIYYNGGALAHVGENLPSSNGDFVVTGLTFSRISNSSCNLAINLGRNDSNVAKKIGGRDKIENVPFGCAWNVGNDMVQCSTRGASSLGRWDHDNNGIVEWLENSFDNAVLGDYDGTVNSPPSRFTITNNGAATTDWAAGLEDAVGLPSNYVIRWGNETASGNGVGIWGVGNCVRISDVGGVATPFMNTCDTGTTIRNGLTVANGGANITGNSTVDGTLTSSGALTVQAGGANVIGDSEIDGVLDVHDTLTVSSGGANITGNSQVNGGLTVSGSESIGGNLTVSGSSTLSSLLRVQGAAATIDGGIRANNNVAIMGRLYVRDNVTAQIYYTHSDRRFKEDILPLDSELQNLLELEPVSYNWIDKSRGDKQELGLIAQEVQKVYPDLVKQGVDGYLSVNYQGLISPLINAVQDLYKMVKESIFTSETNSREIASLKEKNQKLEKENEALKARLERVEKALGL